jgi:LysM repeat protein
MGAAMDDRRGARSQARRGSSGWTRQRRATRGGQVRRDNQYAPYAVGLVVVVAALATFLYIGLNWATGPGRVAALATPPTPTSAPVVAEPTAAPAPAAPTEGAIEQTYVVKAGDNPANIAQRFRVKTEDLIAYNNIDDPRRLQVGQTLRIPPPAAAP